MGKLIISSFIGIDGYLAGPNDELVPPEPSPDLFLYAADAMLTDPADCLVIEDSPAGIVAAKRAGMRVFAFLGGGHIGPAGLRADIEALEPDALFDDMHDLPALVEQAQGRMAAS